MTHTVEFNAMPTDHTPSRMSGIVRSALVAAAALCSVAPASHAQVSGTWGTAPFSAAWMSAGTLLFDVTKLNPHFERNDLPLMDRPGFFTLSNDGYSAGLGGYGTVLNRLVLGGEWIFADLGEESSPSGKTNAMTTTYAVGTVGFAALTGWRLNIIPTLGLGIGSATLTLRSRNGGPTVSDQVEPTFDEIVMSPGSLSKIKGSYIVVQPGLAIDFIILPQQASTMGLVLGARLSSLLSPNRTTWTYNGRSVFGGPDAGPTAGSIRLVAGVGGFRLGGAPGR